MDIQTTIEIEGFIIEVGFRYNEYIDDTNGLDIECCELLHDQTHIISVVDTETNELFRDDFKDSHWDLINKWLETNDPIEDGIG